MRGRGRLRIPFAVVLGILLGTACSVTRKLPEGTYLVRKVTVETDESVPRKERITASELEKYIRQTPNKRLLGTNVYVWLYQQANPDKQNGWNNWKRRLGQAPVLLDMNLTQRSCQNLKVYMDSKGYFASSATFEVDTVSKPRKATIVYRTRQREPYRIDSISYEFRDSFLGPLILADTAATLLRRGDNYDVTVLEAESKRIAANLKGQGYYDFSTNNIQYSVDTLAGDRTAKLKVIVKQNLKGYDTHGNPILADNKLYRISRVNILPGYDPLAQRRDSTAQLLLDTLPYHGLNVIYEGKPNIRPSILRQAVPLYPNYIYDLAQINRTYTDLMSMGYFKSARIVFTEEPQDPAIPTAVTYVGDATDSTELRSTDEAYLACNILCTPTLRQGVRLDLEGSTTSSFYGLKATVGYQNRNIFRGAEALDISFTAGYEFMKAPDARKKRATEIGGSIGLTLPRFLLPWRTRRFRSVNQPRTKLEFSLNMQDRTYYRRTLSSASLTYMWTNSRYSSFSLRPIDINIVDVGYLDPTFLEDTQNQYLINSYKTQLIAGLGFTYTYNNQLRNPGGNATGIRFSIETSGNLIDGLAHLFSHPSREGDFYTVFAIRYSQYFRTDLSLSRKITLGEKTAIAGRLYGGVAMAYGNSESIPFDRLFYAGGSNSMRGWAPRTLGPGSVPRPDLEFPTQLGDMKIEANLELRFPIWGIVHGATFFDAGNIFFLKSNPSEYDDAAVFRFRDFYRKIGFNTGLGLRFDIKFAVLRLDWGIPLHDPNRPAGERWIHGLKWKDTALNFGVGYPF